MLYLSNTSAYAVHALSWLHHRGGTNAMIRDIAQGTGIPKPFLAKILNQLNHSGLVKAKRGYRGGISLIRPANRISLLEIVKAADGENWIGDCPLKIDGCAGELSCPIHKAWGKLSGQFRTFLGNTTLADTVSFSQHKSAVSPPRINARRSRKS